MENKNPFNIIEDITEGQWFIVINNNIIAVCQTKQECEEMINNKSWELIANFASLVAYKTTEKFMKEYGKTKKQKEKYEKK